MKHHVCLFTDSLQPSGVGEHILALAAHLRTRYNLSLICPPTTSGLHLIERARSLGLSTLALEARDDPDALDALCRWLRLHSVDILHVHAGIGWEGFGGADAARMAGVPHLVRTEHLPYLLTHPVQIADHARTIEIVDRVICVGAGVYDSYFKEGVPAGKLRLVCNGIDPEYARRASLNGTGVALRLGLPSDALIALTVGRFTPQKGHNTLLQAAQVVAGQEPRAYFVWAGQGELEEALQKETQTMGLAERIRFLGARNDVPELMAAASVFVLPSHFEGLPLAALEAMASGLPVVGTDVCGIAEVVEERVTGRLVKLGDAPALAEVILETLQQPNLAARWGASGKRRQAQRFSLERMVEKTVAVYDELLTGGRKSLTSISWSLESNLERVAGV